MWAGGRGAAKAGCGSPGCVHRGRQGCTPRHTRRGSPVRTVFTAAARSATKRFRTLRAWYALKAHWMRMAPMRCPRWALMVSIHRLA
jgi:hypothetical protein